MDVFSQTELERDPFTDERVQGLFYPGGGRADLRDQLLHNLRYAGSILLLKGVAGVGRGCLIESVKAGLPDDTIAVSLDASVFAGVAHLCTQLAEHLDLSTLDEQSCVELWRDWAEKRKHVLIIVNKADNLDRESWRWFSQGVADFSETLHVLLVGSERLVHPSIAVDVEEWNVEPFSRQELQEYLLYRLNTAGWRDAMPFTEQQISQLYGLSQGVPRVINEQASIMYHGLGETRSVSWSQKFRFAQVSLLLLGVALIAVGIFMWADRAQQDPMKVSPLAIKPVASERITSAHSGEQLPSVSDKTDAALPSAEGPAELPRLAEPGPGISSDLVEAKSVSAEKAEVAVLSPVLAPVVTSTVTSTVTSIVASVQKPKKEPTIAPVDHKPAEPIAPLRPYTDDEQSLLGMHTSRYAIQLLAVREKPRLDKFLKSLSPSMTVKTYRRTSKGKLWYMLTSGEYRSKTAARAAISKLPAAMKKNRPWPKSLAAIQEEIHSAQLEP